MENEDVKQHSIWKTTGGGVSYPRLAQDIEVDTAVIGGGISGVLTAYLLAKEGQSVALVEAREIGNGCTGGTTAKLSAQHQLIYAELIEREGLDIAKQYYEANMEGIRHIGKIVEEHGVDCDFKEMDAFVFTQEHANVAELRKEADAYRQIGIDGGMTDDIPLPLDTEGALMMHGQAQFHPLKFLHGLLREFKSMGGHIYQHTRYMDKDYTDSGLLLTTDTNFTITCRQAVLATLFPVEDPHSFYSDTLKPMTTHLTAIPAPESLTHGMFINVDDPMFTFRSTYEDGEPILVIGGKTHPTGNGESTDAKYESIRNFAQREFGITGIRNGWSEHDMMTPDRRPFIGPIEKGDDKIYVMTGYNKWGFAFSGTASRLITDLITGRDNRHTGLLSPGRDLSSWKQDDGTSGNSVLDDAARLKNGEARKFEQDGKPAGMYRDETGELHFLDLACTHLGCEVGWNDGDETWDCPCHGSVFEGSGGVIAGPAKLPLKPIRPF
ncbi:putative Rieske 2Fe-2S iron-sulfur protein YhfW [Sporosarcina sp. NCCP-2716]|uniref:FAD-dependent oxidoreductase n=1 Tax=Sporosarcina sp. NCCP-2716 TaxID=2943679 RepID=UPI00203A392C|nr:FAD-dependent oxidoreductase [Sporosarcina sp. NCCP-2716]GKV69227.1 putative Rieske 2Fe-2S iron-sulfur protein YhfW [Sporosarcina sp. NCCP-2716]